jgi:hypothetical protein
MQDKFKKIDKTYVLSDSSVNEYGFRLLTSGYQLELYSKNPIGYYMHKRENGVVLKWEDLHIANDTLYGKPVINLSHERGQQTYDEVACGFLNAASLGHIVVLEYSVDPAQMLPGQTGPTITKWYNKECSLVDIPGNSNALTQLFDIHENEINLLDFGNGKMPGKSTAMVNELQQLLCKELNMNSYDEQKALKALSGLSEKLEKSALLQQENLMLRNEKQALQQELNTLTQEQNRLERTALLDRALEERKITTEMKTRLMQDYADNIPALKLLLNTLPAYRSIVETLKQNEADKTELQWSWDDFENSDPAGRKLQDLKARHPERYKEIFKQKFEAPLGE